VTCIPIARQLPVKHSPTEANVQSSRTSITRQRIRQHVPLTTEVVFLHGYKEVFSSIEWREESSFETPASRNISSGAEEFNLVENNACVISSDSEAYKSVARIRLLKTDNPSACVTVNVKCVLRW
jgi:hypothetical protein